MLHIKKIRVLSGFLFLSLLKMKATQLFAVLSIIILILSWSVSSINIAVKYKLLEDVLLTSQMFMLHIAALFYTFEYLQKERSGGIMIVPFSTGISRTDYIFSVLLSLSLLLILLGSIFLSIDTLFLYLVEGEVALLILWQLFLYLISAILLATFILLFSQFVSTMNSVIYTLTLFIIGNTLDEVYYYSLYMQNNEYIKDLVMFIFYALPNFSIYDFQSIAVNRSNYIFFDIFIHPIIYTVILYSIIVNILLWKFNTRVLRVGE